MTINIGNICLLVLILISALTSIPFFYKKSQIQKYIYKSTYIQFIITTVTLLKLIELFINSDYRFINVALNTHKLVPILYKIAGVWGNHEGSMLLMIWLLCILNIAFMIKGSVSKECKKLILSLQSLIVCLLTSFVFFISNPFIMAEHVLTTGHGFNPLLQDYTLAIHPPILYYGYIGLSIVFSSLIVGLQTKNISKNYINSIYGWILTPLGFLTLGLSLGGWWAYRELGWGGFWFWDPVENVSLIIVLTAISLLHIAKLSLTKQIFLKWTTLLGILAFVLAILSLLLVRSGALVSVHSFAVDKNRGLGLILILGFISLISIINWYKFQKFIPQKKTSISFLSRESGIVLQNVFVMTTCLIILIALIYPVFLGLFLNKTISVGELFYTETLQFIFLPTIVLMVFFPFLKWEKDSLKIHLIPIITSLVSATLTTLAIYNANTMSLGTSLYILFSISCIISMFVFHKQVYYRRIPMILGHLGFVLLVLGAAFCWSWQTEDNTSLAEKGTYKNNKQYEIKLENITYQKGENYLSRTARISLYKNHELIGIAFPETRFYPIEQTFTHESSIIHSIYGDVYFTLGKISQNNHLHIKIKYKPFVYLVWCGSVLMAISAFLCVFTRSKNEKNFN